jgi:hypothetical protein
MFILKIKVYANNRLFIIKNIEMKFILIEWLGGLVTSIDDIYKFVVGLIGVIFGGGKIYDYLQKVKEGRNKVEEAKINAEKEIQTNRDKHLAEVEKYKQTIRHQEGEIKYKDGIITKKEYDLKEYRRKNEDLIRVNEEKDKERNEMYERLIECEKKKPN